MMSATTNWNFRADVSTLKRPLLSGSTLAQVGYLGQISGSSRGTVSLFFGQGNSTTLQELLKNTVCDFILTKKPSPGSMVENRTVMVKGSTVSIGIIDAGFGLDSSCLLVRWTEEDGPNMDDVEKARIYSDLESNFRDACAQELALKEFREQS